MTTGSDEEDVLYERHRIEVDMGQLPMRIDKYLMRHIPNVSRTRIQQAAEYGYLRVGDVPVKSNYKVKPEDVITVMMNRPRYEGEIEPEDIPLDIVYEDDDLLVINKQAGLCVHPGVGNWTGTLVNAIAWHLKDNPDYDPNNPDIGLVHRIDKDTTGLIVVAKTSEAKTSLGKQFFDKTTRRQYNALVWGLIAEDTGTIRTQIARDVKDRQRFAVYDDPEIGKSAVTHYTVLERLGYVTLVQCQLETGRTHQIRVHMKHIGHPLFSDERYGGCEILKGTTSGSYRQFVQGCFEACPRQALHARTLGFTHPRTGQEMFFDSPLPPDMALLLDRWRNYIAHRTT